MAAVITFKYQGGSSGGGSSRGGGSSFADRFSNSAGKDAGAGFLSKFTKAANTGAAMLGSEAAGMAGMLGAAGPYGAAVLAATAVMKQLWETVKQLDQNFVQLASDIAPYSAAVSVSQANNQVADQMQQIRRAEKYGESAAGYSDSRGALGRQWTDFVDALLNPLMDFMANRMDVLTEWLDFFTGIVESAWEIGEPALKAFDEVVKPAALKLVEIAKALAWWIDWDVREREKEDQDKFDLGKWLDKLGGGLPKSSFEESFARIPLGVTIP